MHSWIRPTEVEWETQSMALQTLAGILLINQPPAQRLHAGAAASGAPCTTLPRLGGGHLLHVVLALLLIELALLLSCCVLILLVLTNEVVHVALGLGELHLIHALTSVPVQECFPAEHGSEELGYALEHLLDRRGVAEESNSHLEPLGRDVAHACFDVVWDPLNKIGGVFVLHIEHLLIHLLRRHAAAEECCSCEVTPMSWVCSAHHVLCIKHLLSELRHCQGTVLLRTPRRQLRKTCHEEVEPR